MLTPPIEIGLTAGVTGRQGMLTPSIEIGLTAGVTGRQGMLTPPIHLIPPEVRVGPILKFVFSPGLMRLITACYFCYFINAESSPPYINTNNQ
jgi:hypothetical protein